jgi:hypothetical protein
MDTESLIPFVIVGVFIVVVIFWITDSRRKRNQMRQLSDLAAQNGWTLTPASGQTPVTLSGIQDGIRWEMTSRQQPSSDETAGGWLIEWCSNSTRLADGNVVLVPGGSMLADPSSLGGKAASLVSGILTRLVDLPLRDATPVSAGSEEFRKKYTAFASSPEVADPVLIGVERMLVEWPAPSAGLYLPRLAVDASGVTIHVDPSSAGFNPAEKAGSQPLVERIVQLGVAAARSIRDYA